jgi:hypothetical protein
VDRPAGRQVPGRFAVTSPNGNQPAPAAVTLWVTDQPSGQPILLAALRQALPATYQVTFRRAGRPVGPPGELSTGAGQRPPGWYFDRLGMDADASTLPAVAVSAPWMTQAATLLFGHDRDQANPTWTGLLVARSTNLPILVTRTDHLCRPTRVAELAGWMRGVTDSLLQLDHRVWFSQARNVPMTDRQHTQSLMLAYLNPARPNLEQIAAAVRARLARVSDEFQVGVNGNLVVRVPSMIGVSYMTFSPGEGDGLGHHWLGNLHDLSGRPVAQSAFSGAAAEVAMTISDLAQGRPNAGISWRPLVPAMDRGRSKPAGVRGALAAAAAAASRALRPSPAGQVPKRPEAAAPGPATSHQQQRDGSRHRGRRR